MIALGDELTERERQVLRLAANGLTRGEMAVRLNLALDTVKTHTRRLREKLGARNTTHAVALGLSRGLISMPFGSTPKVQRATAPDAVEVPAVTARRPVATLSATGGRL